MIVGKLLNGGYNDYPTHGIYCLYNLFNNKFYIGSSVNLSKRVWEHFYALKKGNHYNAHLQRSYNKYSNYFIAFVLEDVQEVDELLTREQYWIDSLKACNSDVGYNILPKTNSFIGYQPTEEQRRKQSDAKKGQNHPNFGKHLSEKTRNRIGNGNRGKVRSEETKEKLRQINIGKTLSKETKSKISQSLKNRELSQQQIDQVTKLNAKTIYQYDNNNNLIAVWESGAEAARVIKGRRESIYRVCRGERNTYKGFIWRYEKLSSI